MPKKSSGGYYAVGNGQNVGVYTSWAECEANVKGYSGAQFKKFSSESDAQAFVNACSGSQSHHTAGYGGGSSYNRSQSSASYGGSSSSYGHEPSIYGGSSSSYRSSEPMAHIGGSSLDFSSIEHHSAQRNKPSSASYSYSSGGSNRQFSCNSGNKGSFDKCRLPFIVDKDEFVNVYTDGACQQNGRADPKAGVGVWFGDDHPMNISEPVDGPPTNNTAEIQAARYAVESAAKAGIDKVRINTDSEFLINCTTNWMNKWKNNGWKTAAGGDVKNRVELEKLDKALKNVKVDWKKVPAHSGVRGNEMADKLASDGAKLYNTK